MGGTRNSVLATVYVGGINIHPGAAEIHSAGTETGEKGTEHICLQWVTRLRLSLRTAWLYEREKV